MVGQNGGEKTPETRAKEAELADLAARFGQIARGERTEFEKALAKTLQRIIPKETLPWLYDDSPLTAAQGQRLAGYCIGMDDLKQRALGMVEIYNDMRGALEVMLEKLPAIPDPRFDRRESSLPDALKDVKK